MPAEGWMWLAAGLGWGAVNSGDLLAAYPEGAGAVEKDLGSDRLDEILTQKQAERLASSRPEDFALRVAHCQSVGIYAIGYDDTRYPSMLRTILNPPPVLFVKGDVSLLNGQLSIGIVGARRPSAYGMEAVKAIGRGVALGGAIIVSGLAAGLDAEAHKAALAVNGPTIACIAFGHNHCYPAANRKLMEVIERHGAVVSEYPLGTEPEKPFFLHRNRIIAGLSHGLVVAEARRQSGTMSTVNFAIDYGRDVFAVPGSIFSDLSGGTNAMIREGAYLAATASDVLNIYGVELSGEDPVATAKKQAAQGRPQAAFPASAWPEQPGVEADDAHQPGMEADAAQQPGEQTLGELLRGKLGEPAGKISAARALEAFRMIQGGAPDSGGQMDAASRALDEMASAVSDSVEIAARKKSVPPTARAQGKKEVEPFPWSQVEHLSSREMKNAGAVQPAARRQPRPERAATGGAVSLPTGKIEPVRRVEPVEAAQPVFAARAARGQGSAGAATPPKTREESAQGAGKSGQLSDAAKRALAGLGPVPMGLAAICEKSGLSSGEAMAALTELELAGLSRQLAGRQFVAADTAGE